MKKPKPNTVLPKGGRLIKPFQSTFGSWIKQTFDAKVERFGLTWYRVQGGFGGKGGREDWVADIPCACLSASDLYHDGLSLWGKKGSFDQEAAKETKDVLEHAIRRVKEIELELAQTKKTVKLLKAAVYDIEETPH